MGRGGDKEEEDYRTGKLCPLRNGSFTERSHLVSHEGTVQRGFGLA